MASATSEPGEADERRSAGVGDEQPPSSDRSTSECDDVFSMRDGDEASSVGEEGGLSPLGGEGGAAEAIGMVEVEQPDEATLVDDQTLATTESADGNGASSVFDRLVEILDDEQDLEELLSIPEHHMSEAHQLALGKVNDHFNGVVTHGVGNSRKRGRGAAEPQARGGKRGRQTPAKTTSPWQRFLNLTALSLPANVEEHLRLHGDDAALFLNDSDVLENRIASFADDPKRISGALATCYQYTVQITARRERDNIRWCFSMLNIYSIIKVTFPKSSGRTVGPVMAKQISNTFGHIFTSLNVDTGVGVEQLTQWSNFGMKLESICASFGPGSMFYIAEHLTDDFLRNKFTAKGPYHEEAFSHLRDLGLKELSVQSGAHQLGRNIRKLLDDPFRRHLEWARREGLPQTTAADVGAA